MEYGDYGFKVTTNGRALIAKILASKGTLDLSRVAVGDGLVAEGVDLADVHELVNYISDGEIGTLTSENERLYLTVQYSNVLHREIPTFYLSEFIVYAKDPESGENVDLLYATLGNYRQPVPAYRADVPGSVFNFPLVIVLSSEINVEVSATPGLATVTDLEDAKSELRSEMLRVVVSDTPPEHGPAIWFCSDKTWRPTREVYAEAVLGDPSGAADAVVTGEVNEIVYPVLNATVTEEGGNLIATLEQS